jgi:predicted ATP-grasp superfamily ATP-dependent carboligase
MTTGASSKYVTQKIYAPSPAEMRAFGDWLEDFGQRHPGLFLYAASDDMTFVLASRLEKLSSNYIMYQPSLAATMTLLDKSKLKVVASECGLEMPRTWSGGTISELAKAVEGFSGPVLIKPKTQVGLLTKGKGIYCPTPESIWPALETFLERERYNDEILSYDSSINIPLVQAYHGSAMTGMLSIAGFISKDGQTCLSLCSQKVFLRPRRLGVGIGFAARKVPEHTQDQLKTLCMRIGYFGVFEAEFVIDEQSGESLLVDFNPRYYGQMAFEIARGLELPALVYHAAAGDRVALDQVVSQAHEALSQPAATASHYSLGWIFWLMLWTQRLGGIMRKQEFLQWSQWYKDPRIPRFDAVADTKDRLPLIMDVLLFVARSLRHPRDFFRKFFGA